MSLDKAIKYGKEKRKPRVHGSGVCNVKTCSWCMGNLTHKNDKKIQMNNEMLKEVNNK